MQQYQVTCKCGLQLRVRMQATAVLEIYCRRCQQVIFEPSLPSQYSETTDVLPKLPKVDQEQKILGNYEIEKKIGEGGMGQVFLTSHCVTSEKLVIKMLNIDMFNSKHKERIVNYFMREMEILKQLQHPYIVKFRGCGNYQGSPYLAMEFIEGKNLQMLLQQGPIKLSQAIPIIFNIASALEYGKSKNLIHRDIKPDNIILYKDNPKCPKLIDFGLAKCLGEHYYSLTKSGDMMGTLYYMPPEQIKNARTTDHRADIYALGATFYHMLVGEPPFAQFADQGRLKIMEAILKNQLPSLSELQPNIPERIQSIIAKAMAFQLEDRYPTATELKKDLKAFLESLRR